MPGFSLGWVLTAGVTAPSPLGQGQPCCSAEGQPLAAADGQEPHISSATPKQVPQGEGRRPLLFLPSGLDLASLAMSAAASLRQGCMERDQSPALHSGPWASSATSLGCLSGLSLSPQPPGPESAFVGSPGWRSPAGAHPTPPADAQQPPPCPAGCSPVPMGHLQQQGTGSESVSSQEAQSSCPVEQLEVNPEQGKTVTNEGPWGRPHYSPDKNQSPCKKPTPRPLNIGEFRRLTPADLRGQLLGAAERKSGSRPTLRPRPIALFCQDTTCPCDTGA